jgi:hypothetical protein
LQATVLKYKPLVAGAPGLEPENDGIKIQVVGIICQCIFQKITEIWPQSVVAKAVLALGRLMRTTPAIVEIDVNPLMVHAKGQGATALDALIVAE